MCFCFFGLHSEFSFSGCWGVSWLVRYGCFDKRSDDIEVMFNEGACLVWIYIYIYICVCPKMVTL